MSGPVANNIDRSSGVIAASASGINWVATPVTASTLTAEAGNGYWINTTSNTCTITLPASAERGDQIIFIDYARTWGTNKIILDSNGLNYQGDPDTHTVEYSTAGETVDIVYADATQGWVPLNDEAVADAPVAPVLQKGIFAFGTTGSVSNLSNLVSSSGVVATDTTGVGTARESICGTSYGYDKGIIAYGSGPTNIKNLVSSSGVVATDATGVGTARESLAACMYGGDKGIFGFGTGSPYTAITNLVTNVGVVSTDVTGVGTVRNALAACGYGTDKGIFAYGGNPAPYTNLSNLVSNVGVVATDTAGVGTIRHRTSACGYGGDKGIFGYGAGSTPKMSLTNLVSNSGVVSADVTGVGTPRIFPAATGYGGDKGIFGFGKDTAASPVHVSMTNLVSSSGVVATDTTGVGTGRNNLAACGFSNTA
jgi:hypothetical protein